MREVVRMDEQSCSDVSYYDMFMKQRSPSLEIVTATCRLLDRLKALGVTKGTADGLDEGQQSIIAEAASIAYADFPNMDATFCADDARLIVELAFDMERILTNIAQDRIKDAVCDINTFFQDRPLILHITPTPPWTVHHHPEGHSTAQHWRIGNMVAIAYLIETGAWKRIGICKAAGCGNVFVDTTKNGSKKYCSMQCHRREKIREYRDRQRVLMKRHVVQQQPIQEANMFSYD